MADSWRKSITRRWDFLCSRRGSQ